MDSEDSSFDSDDVRLGFRFLKAGVHHETRRLRSLDALRGFDMLWIIGLEGVFRSLAEASDSSIRDAVVVQLKHVPWAGLRGYDLIFPLFMFLSGVAIPWSVGNKLERGAARKGVALGILRRAFLLVLLGMIYNGLLNFQFDKLRVASVLGQIGVAYAIAALVWTFVATRSTRVIILVGVMLGVAVLQLLVPVPGHGAGVLTPEGSINGWIDRHLLSGQLYRKDFDPEGLLCIVSASALTLGGAFAGDYLKRQAEPHLRTVGLFLGIGAGLILAGWTCATLGYPSIKSAWTGTFHLYAGGISLILLGIFHWLIDFPKRWNWSFPLQVVGMNPLCAKPFAHAYDEEERRFPGEMP
ncbi:acyltransferase family protein [Haloferula sp.]|uniref:acyltransferase family protein n=1 Tax=Haloferula sp. TaxID=2497595 RepID=UPI003C79534D